ncbi:hypothetical protein QJS64_12890 [Paraclostridium bifermentans]|uniref:DUF11 domain-containing protein n=1 Tax=Paraclostridium bifermentans TaxID=1490 RepID=A0ABY8R104_PARBF|nr:hypothetical protein QJS64_12890 [Paraclostridium bifermentans]
MKKSNIKKILVGLSVVSIIGLVGFTIGASGITKDSKTNITSVVQRGEEVDSLLESISNAKFECVEDKNPSKISYKYVYRTTIVNNGIDPETDVEIRYKALTKDGKVLDSDKWNISEIQPGEGMELCIGTNEDGVYKIELEKY